LPLISASQTRLNFIIFKYPSSEMPEKERIISLFEEIGDLKYLYTLNELDRFYLMKPSDFYQIVNHNNRFFEPFSRSLVFI
jgi:hypothetical protein